MRKDRCSWAIEAREFFSLDEAGDGGVGVLGGVGGEGEEVEGGGDDGAAAHAM